MLSMISCDLVMDLRCLPMPVEYNINGQLTRLSHAPANARPPVFFIFYRRRLPLRRMVHSFFAFRSSPDVLSKLISNPKMKQVLGFRYTGLVDSIKKKQR